MSNLNFTILIPYHAHPSTLDFVTRQLSYYAASTISFAVIIAITGDETVKEQLEQFNRQLNNPNFTILPTAENDITNWEAFLSKLANALKIVSTPFVMINGADDVIIPEAALDGCNMLAINSDIAAIKGYTACLDQDTNVFEILNDSEVLSESPLGRLKEALKDRDSIFYIIRRTQDLVVEYDNLLNLMHKSITVRKSPYHIEHFKALAVASRGKVCVFKYPWRLYNRHKNNSASHTECAFLRVQSGILEKENYQWFQAKTKNMQDMSYNDYKFLWILHQIRGISVTFKQVAYQTMYKKCGWLDSLKICIYLTLHKIYMFTKKCCVKDSSKLDCKQNFFKIEHYTELKKYYFSEQDIKLIESKVFQ